MDFGRAQVLRYIKIEFALRDLCQDSTHIIPFTMGRKNSQLVPALGKHNYDQ